MFEIAKGQKPQQPQYILGSPFQRSQSERNYLKIAM
jgi:hypothetical protein